ncbi:hypothetical protein CK203_054567 [Vitis vinifera]|uniref:Uncharacterized protein n=1 Tax=Vitis vinifera TaxID=29760 RepID=A0A438FNN7_VITVI|nr:hypothetical protein CK203_065281 [Vitis vinifera]RVW74492.1 hypothetical protein CK203_054567 [Vitis vinifera]
MIQGLSDFRWPRPLETDPSIRDRSKKCAFHKDHGHTTETCRSLQYLVERLIKAGHLKQYLRSDTGGRDVSQHHNSGPEGPSRPQGCSSADLVQASVIGHMGHSLAGLENPGRILSGFNGSSTTSLGDIILPFELDQSLSTCNSRWCKIVTLQYHLGTHMASLHESHPSTYHQMVSFLTNEGQTDLYGSQLAARQCYQIAREAVANQEDASPPEPSIAHDQ